MGLFLSPSAAVLAPSQGQGLVSICSAANVAWYGMHFDSYPWRLQGLLRNTASGSAPFCTPMYRYVLMST